MSAQHTPGPWLWEYTGDRKRIAIGKGLVEGPDGYDVAEVYSDDCGHDEAEANARLIAQAWLIPEMVEALRKAERFLAGFEGDTETLDDPIDGDLAEIRAILARIDGEAVA